MYLLIGDGKGKTTSALGQVIRALGHEKKVLYIQFIKGTNTGEWSILNQLSESLPLKLASFGIGSFVVTDDDKKRAKTVVGAGIDFLETEVMNNDYFLVVLDELNYCFSLGLVSDENEKRLVKLFNDNPGVYFFITGRNPPASFVERADLISNVQKVKHPFDKGIEAKEGVEY